MAQRPLRSSQDADTSDILQRLSRIEATTSHLATAAQVAALSTKVDHLEQQIPRLDKTAARSDEALGYRAAKDDSEGDLRANVAIAISFLALLVTILALLWEYSR